MSLYPFEAYEDYEDEPECLAGDHCLGCGLKNCPIDAEGKLNGREHPNP